MDPAIAMTLTDRLSDKLRAAGIIFIGSDGHPRFNTDRVEQLLDEADSIIRATARRAFLPPMVTSTGPIPSAETRQVSPSQDYFALKEECWNLLNRILIEGGFLADVVPANIGWTHVAGLTDVRNQLRSVNDRLFGEGSWAG